MSKKKPKNIYLNVLNSRIILELVELGYSDKEIISSFKLRGPWAQAVHLVYNSYNNSVSK